MSFIAHPWAFWFLLLLPAFVLLFLLGRRGVERGLRRVGSAAAVRLLLLQIPGARTMQWMCVALAAFFLILAMCGPQWGRDPNASAQRAGHDLVVVLDLSRSMLAEKPTRQERARRVIDSLCKGLMQTSGQRVALVAFAGGAELVFPLTGEINHLRAMARELDADALPASFRPDADKGVTSGTRMGLAVQMAAAVLQASGGAGSGDILLISDGDDPADDGEWKLGIDVAASQKIPVHTVSVGDPQAEYTIPFRGESLQHQGQVVKTKVREAPLEQIAKATGGTFVRGRTDVVPMDRFVREVLTPRQRERALDVPEENFTPRQQYIWFLAPALGFLLSSMLVRECRRSKPATTTRRALAPVSAAIAACALLALGNESLPKGAELIHAANDAFLKGEFDKAEALYDRAALITTDPGLVAFNKATTLYRLRRFEEAEKHYRRCLEDQEASAVRKARCLYDLGNCLVQQGKSAQQLHDAIACYRACLQLASPGSTLHTDAVHNLAAAKMIWLKLPADEQNPPKSKDPNDPGKEEKPEPKNKDTTTDKKNGDEKTEIKEADVKPEDTVKKMAAGGKLMNLPDDEQLRPLSPTNTRELLEREMQRMLRDRRETRASGGSSRPDVRDW